MSNLIGENVLNIAGGDSRQYWKFVIMFIIYYHCYVYSMFMLSRATCSHWLFVILVKYIKKVLALIISFKYPSSHRFSSTLRKATLAFDSP